MVRFRDTGASTGAISETDDSKVKLSNHSAIMDIGRVPNFHVKVVNGKMDQVISTAELRFKGAAFEFRERLFAKEILLQPLVTLSFSRKRKVIFDVKQKAPNFSIFVDELKQKNPSKRR